MKVAGVENADASCCSKVIKKRRRRGWTELVSKEKFAAKIQFIVFQKFVSEESEIRYWYIIHDMKEISEIILRFQQWSPSQAPTNHPFCRLLVYQCLRTKKKITHFKFKHQYPIVYSAEVERSSLSLFPPSHPNESFFLFKICHSSLCSMQKHDVPCFLHPKSTTFSESSGSQLSNAMVPP